MKSACGDCAPSGPSFTHARRGSAAARAASYWMRVSERVSPPGTRP
jgi:hypothetical protein